MPTLPEIGENERALAVRAEDAASHLPAVLKSQGEFETAGETLRQLQTLSKTLEDKRVELTSPVLEAKRRKATREARLRVAEAIKYLDIPPNGRAARQMRRDLTPIVAADIAGRVPR